MPESASPSELPAGVTVISIRPMYSAAQVAVATVLGGPLGGAWLIALNYKRLDTPRKARTAVVLGVLAMVAVNALGLLAPYGVMRWMAMLPGIVVAGLAELLQGAGYHRHVAACGTRGSNWRAAGVGVLCLPAHFGPIVCSAIASSHTHLVR